MNSKTITKGRARSPVSRPAADPRPGPDYADIRDAVGRLQVSIERSNEEIAKLSGKVVRVLEVLEARSAQILPGASIPAAPEAGTKAIKAGAKTINWIIGPPDNMGWAYGNNAKRLSEHLRDYNHQISSNQPADIAVYFDALVAERYPVEARRSILRIGGPRPLDRLYGEDEGAMRDAFKKFDAIIALNHELYLRVSKVHPNVHLIPNALDLNAWKPGARKVYEDRVFTVGFAASLKSTAEAEIKGLSIAQGGASRVGVKLLQTSKGKAQITHDRMLEDFYSQIDVLVHPCGPGREGTSNVIMEAMALGIPVITTIHSGFHAELIVDGKNGLIRERSELEFADAIATLQRDPRLRKKIGAEARVFAETHHNLKTVAASYQEVMRGVFSPRKPPPEQRRKVAFVPFWEPVGNFGSSRLRAHYPSEYLKTTGAFDVSVGYSDDADVVIVVQMCDDDILNRLSSNKNQFLIYDVCDKYYENGRIFKHVEPHIDSISRYNELVERADLIIVPTRELKAEVASRAPHKPVKFIPEPADYGAQVLPVRTMASKSVLWFGNPDRGNFESAKWMLERLRDRHGFKLRIVSRKSFFKKYPEFLPHVEDWSLEAMKEAFKNTSLCVVSADVAEQAKSPNRFIAAMMHGVATVSSNSPACSEILEQTGHEFADVSTEQELDRFVGKIRDDGFRKLYVSRVQRLLNEKFGEKAITDLYADMLRRSTFSKPVFAERPRRIAFVSHNLSLAEGAPWSLFELAVNLRGEDIQPFGFSAAAGPLEAEYDSAAIPLKIFDSSARHAVRVFNTRFDALRKAFRKFLSDHQIDAVICNTVKSAPFADFAAEMGIASAIIVRESYTAEERFSYFQGAARTAATRGLINAPDVVFVAQTSRDIWSDQPFKGRVHVIPNGISAARFAHGAEQTKRDARAILGLPEDNVVALCVGTINARKGQQQIMDAFAALPAEVIARTNLVFLGAVENSAISGFVQAHNDLPPEIRSQVSVVPATTDVAPFYRAADIALMNSSSEAYPRAVVEALMFGLPVLSTKVFGVTEQITHARSGYLYDFDDMEAWTRYFTLLVTDHEGRLAMSIDSRQAFWRLTGHKEMALAYKSIIAGLLK